MGGTLNINQAHDELWTRDRLEGLLPETLVARITASSVIEFLS